MEESEKLKNLEQRLESLEIRLDQLDDRTENGIIVQNTRKVYRSRGGNFWGLLLIAIGVFWLGRNLGWFDIRLPLWPTLLILFGIYILVSDSRKSGKTN